MGTPANKIRFYNGVKFKMNPKEFVRLAAPHVDYEDVLFKEIKGCRKRGYLTRIEFLKLCFVKTNRVFNKCKENSSGQIKYWTKKAFSPGITDENRIKNLMKLDGVGMPRASFILSAWKPKEFGTYDYRIRDVIENRNIRDFEKPDKKTDFFWYLAELKLLRKWRDELNLKAARQVEYALWRYQFIGEILEKEFSLE